MVEYGLSMFEYHTKHHGTSPYSWFKHVEKTFQLISFLRRAAAQPRSASFVRQNLFFLAKFTHVSIKIIPHFCVYFENIDGYPSKSFASPQFCFKCHPKTFGLVLDLLYSFWGQKKGVVAMLEKWDYIPWCPPRFQRLHNFGELWCWSMPKSAVNVHKLLYNPHWFYTSIYHKFNG